MEKKYGKEMTLKILQTPVFNGATCGINKDGSLDYYECDIESAIHYLKTGIINGWD